MFKSDVQSARFCGYSYAEAVTTGQLLCQWYADQSGTIHKSVVLSNGQCHESGNNTLAIAKCLRSRSQPDWDLGCLVDCVTLCPLYAGCGRTLGLQQPIPTE